MHAVVHTILYSNTSYITVRVVVGLSSHCVGQLRPLAALQSVRATAYNSGWKMSKSQIISQCYYFVRHGLGWRLGASV